MGRQGIAVDAMLADRASVENGRLYVHRGGWDVIVTRSTPAAIASACLALLCRIPPAQEGRTLPLEVRLDGPAGGNGETLVSGTLRAVRADGREAGELTVPAAIDLTGTLLPETGAYRLVIAVDGVEIRALPFEVTAA